MPTTDVPLPGAIVRVHAPVAPMLADPRVSSGQVSQALYGHLLAVGECRDDWCRVLGLDGYAGWTHHGYLRVVDVAVDDPEPATPAAPDDSDGSQFVVGFAVDVDDYAPRVSLGCTARDDEGQIRRLPLGAWLTDHDRTLLDGETVAMAERAVRFPADGEAIVRTAARYFEGTSYQWGGVTPWGADCSGLVQTVFALHGVALPRDAYQQAELGADAGTDPLALRAADLLFFSDRDDRRVTHVGIATGDRRMAHLALGRGGWALDRLDDAGDPYVAALMRRFLFARRM